MTKLNLILLLFFSAFSTWAQSPKPSLHEQLGGAITDYEITFQHEEVKIFGQGILPRTYRNINSVNEIDSPPTTYFQALSFEFISDRKIEKPRRPKGQIYMEFYDQKDSLLFRTLPINPSKQLASNDQFTIRFYLGNVPLHPFEQASRINFQWIAYKKD